MNFNLQKTLASAATLLAVIFMTVKAPAAPVSPDDARVEASEFLHGNSTLKKNAPSAASQNLTLAKTVAKDGTNCYYVFNFNQGFVIVSADDRLVSILGYSDNGEFDENRIPENMKWWLDSYCNEIETYLKSTPAQTNVVIPALRTAYRQPIAPLLKTTWDQGAPYNDNCPVDKYAGNQRSATGCVATATAQLMKFHEWPQKPTGSNGGVTFEGTTYDWRNMIDSYLPGQYNARQAVAVATLMRQVGASVNMQYSAYASGAYDSSVPVALTTYFDYSYGIRMVWKDYTAQTEWNNIIYNELAAGRPVYYSGSSNEGGHAFVCDGYSQNEYFHFNWGWGGYEDGYYVLSALNPAQGGAGSYEGGYNYHQTIMTGIVPRKDNPNAKKQISLLATGGFYHDKNDSYVIKDGDIEPYIIYNPMGYTVKINVGLKVTGVTDPSYSRYVLCGSAYELPPNYGFQQLDGAISNLADGVYHVTPVFSESTSLEWQDVQIPLGKQSYVTLTVKNGRKSFANEGPDASHKPNVIFADPIPTSVVYANTALAFRVPVINTGLGDFNGQFGFALYDKNDDFGDVISINDNLSIAARSYRELEMRSAEPLKPGTYVGNIVDLSNNTYISNYILKVVDGGIKDPEGVKTIFSNISPAFYVSGSSAPLYFTVQNLEGVENVVNFKYRALDMKTLEFVKDLPGDYTLTVNGTDERRVYSQPRDWELDPGEYMLEVVDLDGNPLSKPYPLIVKSEVKQKDGIYYVVTDEKSKSAKVVAPLGDPYTLSVVVPAEIDGYKITAVDNGAFTFATPTAVTLGKNIANVPDLSFYCVDSMKQIFVLNTDVPKISSKAIQKDNAKKCWIYTPNSVANDYFYSGMIWSWFGWSVWHITLAEGVEIVSGLDINPKTGTYYQPYCMNPSNELTIGFTGPASQNLLAIVQNQDQWLMYESIDPRTQTLTLPALGRGYWGGLSVKPTNIPAEVEEIEAEEEAPADVFTIDGKVVLRSADKEMIRTLAPGIYILSTGKKILIK